MNNTSYKEVLSTGRTDIFKSQVSVIDLKGAVEYILSRENSRSGYICLPNTYVIARAYYDNVLRFILNDSLLTLPDGKPIEIVARMKGIRNLRTVSGYWLLDELLRTNLTHYFYGADLKTLELIRKKLQIKYPNARIIGYNSPPFIKENEIKENKSIQKDIEQISNLKPDLIWIGISSPKQDILMSHFSTGLQRGLMIGIGAVFNYVAGTHKISPEWMKRMGIRWVFRLFQEPRLWKRYLYSNTVFIYLFLKEIAWKNMIRHIKKITGKKG